MRHGGRFYVTGLAGSKPRGAAKYICHPVCPRSARSDQNRGCPFAARADPETAIRHAGFSQSIFSPVGTCYTQCRCPRKFRCGWAVRCWHQYGVCWALSARVHIYTSIHLYSSPLLNTLSDLTPSGIQNTGTALPDKRALLTVCTRTSAKGANVRKTLRCHWCRKHPENYNSNIASNGCPKQRT